MRKSFGIVVVGRVVWFSGKKGYGFICGDDKKQYFVHQSDVRGNIELLVKGICVQFNITQTAKGLRALNVRVKNDR